MENQITNINPQVPNKPTQPIKNNPIKIGHKIFIVVFFVVVLALVSLLTYYKVYPLVIDKFKLKTNPPSIIVTEPLIDVSNVNIEEQNLPLLCPVKLSFCKDLKNYEETTFSAKLTKGSPIYAAFDGAAQGMKPYRVGHPEIEDYSEILLVNKDRGLMAHYYYQGDVISRQAVRAGDLIATSSGEPIIFMGNQKFIFQVDKAISDGIEKMKLIPEKFK